MFKPHTGELIFFWILFGLAGLLTFAVMRPYVTPIFLAIVFAILFSPVHDRMLSWCNGRKTWSALFTVLVVLCVLIIPLIIFGTLLSQEIFSTYSTLAHGEGVFAFIDGAAATVENYLQLFAPSFQLDIDAATYAKEALRWVGANLNNLLSGAFTIFLNLVLVVITMYFLYRDGDKLRDFALRWSPLADNYDQGILQKLTLAIGSVVKGSLATAITQGLLAGIGFAIFGVPSPVLWGVIATITSFIPSVGTAIVTVPVSVFFILSGHPIAGTALLLWSILVVGLIDNVMRPLMIHRGVDIHPFLIFLSVLGGLAYFGPVGFLAGPIILAFFFALLDIYPAIVKGEKIRTPPAATLPH